LFSEKEETMSAPASRVSRVLMTGPLAPFAEAYSVELRDRGYTERSAVGELRQVGRLSRWLEAGGLSVAELSRERVGEFVVWQRVGGRHRSQWSRPGLLCLLEVLEGLGVIARRTPASVSSPIEVLLSSFERYLLSERGLAPGTIVGYVAHARWFLEGLGRAGVDGLSAAEVTGAVLRKASSGVSVAAAQYFVSGLRAFLRFCFLEGLVETDLSQAALVVRGRRASLLPRGISPADARALLGSCDRRRSLGRRDYALIILLLRLGLRRGEVARLTLDDIDWRAGELVIHGKGSREDRLPLPDDVGAAIAAYVQRGRPASERREVFLRSRAPYAPIASGTVASTVRRACRRAGIPEVGSHRLRHTTACEMVGAGVPIVRIGQVLRHRSLQSTAIYARVDIEQLRRLAAPWPAGSQR
jgi:site-specific recombinase XerD